MDYKNFDSIYIERKNRTFKDKIYNGIVYIKDELISIKSYIQNKFLICFPKKVRLDDYGDYSSGEDESLVGSFWQKNSVR